MSNDVIYVMMQDLDAMAGQGSIQRLKFDVTLIDNVFKRLLEGDDEALGNLIYKKGIKGLGVDAIMSVGGEMDSLEENYENFKNRSRWSVLLEDFTCGYGYTPEDATKAFIEANIDAGSINEW